MIRAVLPPPMSAGTGTPAGRSCFRCRLRSGCFLDELAFYDAVTQNDSAVNVQGEGVLANIARDLVAVMRRDVQTDWTCATTSAPNCARP